MQFNVGVVGLATLAVTCVACSRSPRSAVGFASADEKAIRSLDSSYVAAWLRDDTAGVLSTLAPGVVLMPAGQFPLTTTDAVKRFWWPQDGSHTRVLTFTRRIDELKGVGDLAYIRGTDSVTFVYDKGTSHSNQISRSMTLGFLSKQPDGTWKIARMMWGTRTK